MIHIFHGSKVTTVNGLPPAGHYLEGTWAYSNELDVIPWRVKATIAGQCIWGYPSNLDDVPKRVLTQLMLVGEPP